MLKSTYRIVEIALKCNEKNIDFPPDWLYHFRWGKGKKEASKINGQTIRFATVGGRTTAVVSKPKRGSTSTADSVTATATSDTSQPVKKEVVGSKRKAQEKKSNNSSINSSASSSSSSSTRRSTRSKKQ